MLEFFVQDMTCGHCVGSITKAVQQADPGASVECDVKTHRVRVEGVADADAVKRVIADAGYTPLLK